MTDNFDFPYLMGSLRGSSNKKGFSTLSITHDLIGSGVGVVCIQQYTVVSFHRNTYHVLAIFS